MNGQGKTELGVGWKKSEVVVRILGSLLVPIVILVAGHWLTVQQAEAAEVKQNADRAAELLGHLASVKPNERILAIEVIDRQQLLLEPLGPMMIHLDRTKKAFRVWSADNTAVVTDVIFSGNWAITNLLTHKRELIPTDLTDEAAELLEHYEIWFREHDRVRKEQDTAFVYVGPKGFPFPKEAELAFREEHARLLAELEKSGGDS